MREKFEGGRFIIQFAKQSGRMPRRSVSLPTVLWFSFFIRIPFSSYFWIRILIELRENSGSSSGSDRKYSFVHNANDFNGVFSWHFKASFSIKNVLVIFM
jgi:hypothetical protein